MNPVTREVRLLATAWLFLTRVPLPGASRIGWSESMMRASTRHLPAVGALVGAACGTVFVASQLLVATPVAVGLAIATGLVMTGCLHEDGWADTCDAFGGGVPRERALQIMKDSRLGTYGVSGLVVMLGLRAAALLSMPIRWVPVALVVGHSVSRAAPVGLMRTLPYAGDREHARSKPLASRVDGSALPVAVLWSLLVLGSAAALMVSTGTEPVVAWAVVAGCLASAALVTTWCRRWFRLRIDGFTGDTLGACQQLVHLGVLLTFATVHSVMR